MNQTDLGLDLPQSSQKSETEKKASDEFWTGSQQLALKRLNRIYALKKLMPEIGGVKLRTHVLMVGQTGVGKTELVRRFARDLRMELCSIPCNSWIPHGAATTPHTVGVIGQFVLANRGRALVYFDEIDKILPQEGAYQNAWNLGIFGEILAVLDGDGRLSTMGWNQDNLAALKEAYVVGAGAFQHLATAQTERKPGIGFGSFEPETQPHYSESILARGLPPEVATRFNAEILVLESPTPEECAQGIARLHRDLPGVPLLQPQALRQLSQEAASSGLGMRWFECYAMKLADQILPQDAKCVQSGPAVATVTPEKSESLSSILEKAGVTSSTDNHKPTPAPSMSGSWTRTVPLGSNYAELRKRAFAASAALKRFYHRAKFKREDLQQGTNTLFEKRGMHCGLMTEVYALGWSCMNYFHAKCTKSDAFGHEVNFARALVVANELERLVIEYGDELDSAHIWQIALDAAMATAAFGIEWTNIENGEGEGLQW